MFLIPALLTYLFSLGYSDSACFSISIEPKYSEIQWKTDVTLICNCACASCYDDKTNEYRMIEVHDQTPSGSSNYLGDMEMEKTVGVYVIRDVSKLFNNVLYTCMASRVGSTASINFTVIEPPPIIETFSTGTANDSVTARTVTLTWEIPEFYPNTVSFSIDVADTVKGESDVKTISNASQTEYVVRDLIPNRKFKFTITNYNKLGARGSSEPLTVITLEDVPEAAPQDLTVGGDEPDKLYVSWSSPPKDKTHGLITQYETICVFQCETNCTEQPIEYTNTTLGYTWPLTDLVEDSKYSCKIRAFTSAGPGPYSNPTVGKTAKRVIIVDPPIDVKTNPVVVPEKEPSQIPALVIGVVTAVAIVGLVAVAVFFNRHRLFKTTHTRLKSDNDMESPIIAGNYGNNLQVHVNDPSVGSDDTLGKNVIPKLDAAPHPGYKGPTTPNTISSKPPISTVDFPTHVEQLHENGNTGFNREYTSINPGSGWSCEVGAMNKNKNRYYNVKCYDHTRVKLLSSSGGESDFINANFVDGYSKKNAYIATQGPLPKTCVDFWRMVWEQNCSSIVMVTNLVELARVKCHQYFPDSDSGSLSFGPVTITLKESMALADFTIRVLKLEMAGEESHTVKHFHFTSWPDHGVPPFSNAILSFVRHVKNVKTVESGPVVVHCSAGVGRTGTFMAIDAMLDMSDRESCVDIFGYVTLMRTCRPSMVQTEDQYIFIHDAVLEALTCGVTEVRARDLPDHFQWLLDTDSYTSNERLEDEFKRLGYNIRDLSHHMTTALMDQNASKNRDTKGKLIPYDQCRVWLFPLPQQPYSNYINASDIDGFRNRKAYIATQSPLPQTMDDYWRMVWEMHSLTLVMLNCEEENEPYYAYFPLEGSTDFGNIRVEFVRMDEHRDYNVTILRVYNKEEGLNRTVSHFQYFAWSEDNTPASCSTLLEMITRISKCQQTCANKYPVVTHCDYGMGRTGAFFALCICLDRMKVENVVDVFQTVRTMRSQRPHMVNDKILYRFIFTCLVEYLQALDLYANFK